MASKEAELLRGRRIQTKDLLSTKVCHFAASVQNTMAFLAVAA